MKKLKKDLIFAIPMILIIVALCMLRQTGMTAHAVVSFVGIAVLAAYAIATRKEWKLPALEIATRALYAVALISGIVIMKVHGVPALPIIHKISAVLFFVSFAAALIHKAVRRK